MGRHLYYGDDGYSCGLCGAYGFQNLDSIHDHWRTLHDWCERCCTVFTSAAGKKAHLRDSSYHNICSECDEDFETEEELDYHDVLYHNFCAECDMFFDTEEDLEEHDIEYHNYCRECDLFFDTEEEFQEHDVDQHHLCPECDFFYESAETLEKHDVEYHNLCIECGKYLTTENDLKKHQQTHEPRGLLCYGEPDGCNQTFRTFSAMLVHLECGTCSAGFCEAEIDDIACDFVLNEEYVDRKWEDGQWTFKYKCPSCEKRDFRTLSALYQHAEDVPSCLYLTEGSGCLADLEEHIARNLG